MDENKSVAGVVEYIEQCRAEYGLEFVREARGESEAAIYLFEDAAQKLTDFYFPPDYSEFLRLMGNQTPIDFADDATMNWKELWKQYDAWSKDGVELSPNCLIIAANGFNLEQLALECSLDENGETVGGLVRYAANGSAQHVLADSFVNYLFSRAFLHCAARNLRAIATYQSLKSEFSLKKIADFAEQFGWRKHWFSDSINLCVTAPDNEITVFARQRENHRGWLRLAGQNTQQVAHIGNQICRVADMKLEKWWV